MNTFIDEAVELIEKCNAELEPELLAAPDARRVMESYSKIRRLADYGLAALSRKLDDPKEIARVTGTSVGRARETVHTGKVMEASPELGEALKGGAVSLDQAAQIASAEESAPGAAKELLDVARDEAFHVLRDRARKVKLEAEQHKGLGERQRAARSARSHTDELGMTDVHLRLEPHVGTPIVARAEAEAARLRRAAKGNGVDEPFERHLADAYAKMLAGSAVKGPATRPELVVLVSHEVIKRGWKDVKEGEHCKIPGVGPVAPETAREIAGDAFLSGVLYDGKDLRQIRRWTRNTPVAVRLALELGKPPQFDGISCVDCGNRFGNENDHLEPHAAGGPASIDNFEHRCRSCHRAKTERDRKAGKLKPGKPRPGKVKPGKQRPGNPKAGKHKVGKKKLGELTAERLKPAELLPGGT